MTASTASTATAPVARGSPSCRRLAGRSRWGSRDRRLARGRGDECHGRRSRGGRHGEFGEAEVGVHVVEGREWLLARNELRNDVKSFAEATLDVEHERVVRDGLAKVSECVGEALHLAAVDVDGEGALGECAELDVDEHGARRAVVEELLLEAKPGDMASDAVAVMDDVEQVGGDGVEEPGHHHAVHATPRGVGEARRIAEDMVLQGEAVEDEEDVAAPLGEVGFLEVQSNRN
jgi:hypothetical protein